MKKETIYDETITNLFLLMQSYGEFGLIPRKKPNLLQLVWTNVPSLDKSRKKSLLLSKYASFS